MRTVSLFAVGVIVALGVSARAEAVVCPVPTGSHPTIQDAVDDIGCTEIEPYSVSPGAVDRLAGVEARCPTFSWQTVGGASGYEVVVYQLPAAIDLAAWNLDEAVEVLYVELPAGVNAWTPSLEQGLARGLGHVWFVRGVMAEGVVTEWSEARFFRVAGRVPEDSVTARSVEARKPPGTGLGTESGSSAPSREDPDVVRNRQSSLKTKPIGGTKDVGTASAGIRGEMPDPTGETYGVVGVSSSLDGAGLGAVNTANGPDLVLDGVVNGETDLDVYHWGIDRASSGAETFVMTNSISGELNLLVIGEAAAHSFSGNGALLHSVNAETLDGIDSTGFSSAAHFHDIRYYTETELSTPSAASVHWNNLGSVPAGFADGVDNDTTYAAGSGLDLTANVFSSRGSGYEHMVVVATDGGDFSDIQTAIDSIAGASATHPFLVWVGPGVFTGPVTLKPHVHLQGAGRDVTSIVSTVGTSWPPTMATVKLSTDSSVRDVTVRNDGNGPSSGNIVAMIAEPGTTRSVVSDTTVKAQDVGGFILAAVILGGGTDVRLESVDVSAIGGDSNAIALRITDGAAVSVIGGSFIGQGGTGGKGIWIEGAGSVLDATNPTVIGADGSSLNRALRNSDGASVTVFGGWFVARGGVAPIGILNESAGTSFDGTNVTALAENGVNSTQGLRNQDGPTTVLRGGSFVARTGVDVWGIMNSIDGTLVATGVTAVAESGTDRNFGLYGAIGTTTTLQGGSFSGVGGTGAYGIYTGFGINLLEAVNVIAAGSGGSTESFGVYQITGPVRIGASQIKHGVSLGDIGNVTCYHVFDENFGNFNCVPVSN